MLVEIILPNALFEKTRYRLCADLKLAGVTVPRGFVTDGATVPRAFWWLFPPAGRYFLAAAVHDYLLEYEGNWREANRKFKDALLEQGVSRWVTYTMFSAVQVYQGGKALIKFVASKLRG